MSGRELDNAVREYLQSAGCAEAGQVFRGIVAGAVTTRAAVNASLRRVGATPIILGAWAPPNPEAVERENKRCYQRGCRGRYDSAAIQRRYPGGSFTVYTLRGKS